MPKERLLGSYIVRFSEIESHIQVRLQNLKTGEQIYFETWVAAWLFLEGSLDKSANASLEAKKAAP